MRKITAVALAFVLALVLGCDSGESEGEASLGGTSSDGTAVPAAPDDASTGPLDTTGSDGESKPDTLINSGFDAGSDISAAEEDAGVEDEGNTPDIVEVIEIPTTLSGLQEVLFLERCMPCHSPEKNKGKLVLDSNFIHSALVNKTAKKAPGKKLVVPFDPDASFLVHKIEGTQAFNEGFEMPPVSELPTLSLLNADEIAAIREWINLGALDD